MTHFVRDVRIGLRLLWRQPAFTTIALLALALGIAANTAIFSVVYATLLAPLPVSTNPDQLVMVWSRVQNNRNVTAAGDYLEWARPSRSFQGLDAWTGRQREPLRGRRPDQVQARSGTPGFLTIHGFKMLMGRDFLPEEGTARKDQVVILTNRFWRRGSAATGDPRTSRSVWTASPTRWWACWRPGVADRLESNCSCRSPSRPSRSTTTSTGCSSSAGSSRT